ncbi:MAG: ABC transporter permease [Opitutaceae bacterium]
MLSDLRFALRQLVKSPGFTAVAILMLALGIGVSTSSFSMANAFLLRQLPYPAADRLVKIACTTPQIQQPHGFAPANLVDVRESATSFDGLAMWNTDEFALGELGQSPEKVSMLMVSSGFFHVIGVQPQLGRGFSAADETDGAASVVILPHGTWISRYAGDPNVIGRTVRLNAQPYTVIGVLPESFEAPLVWGQPDYVAPRLIYSGFRTQRTGTWLGAVARLKPRGTLRSAQSELDTLAARLALAHPKENSGLGLRALSLHDANIDGTTRNMLWLMTGLAVTMLIIACANLAGLQVARAFGRSREFAVRTALGGSRRQLMVPLLFESFVLALIGGGLGLVVTLWINDLVGRSLNVNSGPGFAVSLDGHVFAFAALASLLSGLAFGLAPAWFSSRATASDALRGSSRSSTASRGQHRLKATLIVGELALAFALVGVATSFALGVKSFMHRPLGWDMDGLYSGYIALPTQRYNATKQRQFAHALLARLSAIPGVEHASLSTNLPTFIVGGVTTLSVEGQPMETAERQPVAEQIAVSTDFFTTLRIPLKQGVTFSSRMKETDPPLVIINEALANRFWPGANPLGRRLQLGTSTQWIEVVGVVGDIQAAGRLNEPVTRLQVYRPLVQREDRYLSIALRSALTPPALNKEVRAVVASLDAELPVANPGSLRTYVDRVFSNLDLVIINLVVSAFMGLLMAAVGVFGVISQFANQRTRDIGVRIALGATRRNIMRLILGEGLRFLAIGLLLGVGGFFLLNTVLRHSMTAVAFPGLSTLAATMGLLSAAMLFACWLPARRAARTDPMVALRAE